MAENTKKFRFWQFSMRWLLAGVFIVAAGGAAYTFAINQMIDAERATFVARWRTLVEKMKDPASDYTDEAARIQNSYGAPFTPDEFAALVGPPTRVDGARSIWEIKRDQYHNATLELGPWSRSFHYSYTDESNILFSGIGFDAFLNKRSHVQLVAGIAGMFLSAVIVFVCYVVWRTYQWHCYRKIRRAEAVSAPDPAL